MTHEILKPVKFFLGNFLLLMTSKDDLKLKQGGVMPLKIFLGIFSYLPLV